MMQGIGKIETLAKIAERGFDDGPIFDLDMLERQHVLKHSAHFARGMAVGPAQHPFEFQDHRLGDEQPGTAFDHGAGHLLLRGRAGVAILANVVASQDVGIERQDQRLPPACLPRTALGAPVPALWPTGVSKSAGSKSDARCLPRASSIPYPDTMLSGTWCTRRSSHRPSLATNATRLPWRMPNARLTALGIVTCPLLVTVDASMPIPSGITT